MSFNEFLFYATYICLAFGAALILVSALGFGLHVEQKWGRMVVPMLVPLLVMGIAVSALLSRRNLAFAAKAIEYLSAGAGGSSILRVITLSALGLCVAKISGQFLRRKSMEPAAGTPLFVALFVYIVATNWLPSALGSEPVFVHNLFYSVFLFAAAWAARRESVDAILTAAKFSLYLLMLGSLIAAVALPSIAVEPNYSSFLPGVRFRLWGLGAHANSIGPLALLVLLLEYLRPTRGWLRVMCPAMAVIVLVLAQSKTAWGAGGVAACVLAWHRWSTDESGKIRIQAWLCVTGVFIAIFFGALISDTGTAWDNFISSSTGHSLATGTGRIQIWIAAMDEWLRSPLFGYGPDIWGPAFRVKIGMPFAFSAHNQLMQTLSKAGLVGAFALLTYLYLLIRYSFRSARMTRGVSVAILTTIVLRCVSETPLDVDGIFSGEVIAHVVLFALLLRAPEVGCSRLKSV